MKTLLTPKVVTVIACITAVAIGFIVNIASTPKYIRPEISGFAFPAPVSLANVELISENNKILTEEHFIGSWTFIYVGYTFCPDACPITLNTLSQMHAALAKQKAADNVEVLLVSVDPNRDTPERLKEYVKYFNENFTGATGTETNLSQFATQISSVYSLPKDQSKDDYLVDHSSSIILINPKAEVHAIFTPPQKVDLLVADYIKLKDSFNP